MNPIRDWIPSQPRGIAKSLGLGSLSYAELPSPWGRLQAEADLRPASEGGIWDLGFLGSLKSQIRWRKKFDLRSGRGGICHLGLVPKFEEARRTAARLVSI